MRVAVVGYPLLHERQWRLCERYEAAGVDTHLLVPRSWPGIDESDHPPDGVAFTTHYHDALFGGQMGRYLLRGLGGTLNDVAPSVVLTHGEPWTPVAYQTELACSRRGINHLVFTWENMDRVPRMRTQRAAERVLLPRIDGCVAGSDRAEARLRERGFDGHVTVAPETGVDTDRFSPVRSDDELTDLHDQFGVPPDAVTTLYAGRLASEKGVDLILNAAVRIGGDSTELHHLIVGDGDQASTLRRQIRRDGLDAVTLVTDKQPYSLMPRIHALADLFIYPSRTTEGWAEQFGYSVAEAMATGVPVVTTECGSLPWVVGDTGVVCPEDDPEALATAIGGLADDLDRRRRLADAARDRAVSSFGLDAVAETHLGAFERVRE